MDENPVEEQETSTQNRKRTGRLEKDYPGRARWGCITTVVGFGLLSCISVIQFKMYPTGGSPSHKISSAKNLLATKIKECAYSEARGGGTRPSDISRETAELTIRGYRISVGPTCYQATAKSNDNELSDFSLSDDDNVKTCLAGEDPYGCFADKDLTIEQEPGMPGYW